MATIKDVAEKAGVSAATVSRYLTGNTGVTKDKELRIAKAIKDLNYEPNAVGRSLRNAETRMVLVVMSRLVSRCMQGMLDAAHRAGYNIILNLTERNIEDTQALRAFQNGQVDGVIFQDVQITEDVYNTVSQRMPVVQCGDYTNLPGANIVSIDNEEMAYRMARHLISKGQKSIAYVHLADSDGSHGALVDARERGLVRALAEAGLRYDERMTIGVCWDQIREAAQDNVAEYYQMFQGVGRIALDYIDTLPQRPQALLCYNDYIAFGCIRALRERGLRVPEDIAVTGFDGQIALAETDSILSTVIQPYYKIGYEAFSLLLARLRDREGASDGRKILLEADLSLKGSTGDN